MTPILLLLTACELGLGAFEPDDLGSETDGLETDTGRGPAPDTGGATDSADSAGTDDTHEPADTGTAPLQTLDIDSVDPDWDTTLGGTEVVIHGGPFDASTSIVFGTEEANVLAVSSDQITVEAPPMDAAGIYAIYASTNDGSASKTGAFQYYQDATGLGGAMGAFSWYELMGSYWTADSVDYGGALLYLLDEPTDVHWWDFYAPTDDLCTDASYTPDTVYVTDEGLSSLRLAGDGGPVDLAWDDTVNGFMSPDLDASDYTAWSSYTLEPPAWSLPSVAVDDFVLTAGPLMISSPNLKGVSPPILAEGELDFTWTASGADKIIFELILADGTTGTAIEEIYCVATDDGSFSVPPGTFSNWDTSAYIYTYIGRVREATGTFAHDNAESRVAGIWYSVGAIGLK